MKRTFLALAAIAFISTPAFADFFSAGGQFGGKHHGHRGHQTPAYPADAYKRPNQDQPFRTLPRDAVGPAPEQTVNLQWKKRHDPQNPKRKHQIRGSEIRISR